MYFLLAYLQIYFCEWWLLLAKEFAAPLLLIPGLIKLVSLVAFNFPSHFLTKLFKEYTKYISKFISESAKLIHSSIQELFSFTIFCKELVFQRFLVYRKKIYLYVFIKLKKPLRKMYLQKKKTQLIARIWKMNDLFFITITKKAHSSLKLNKKYDIFSFAYKKKKRKILNWI